MNVSSLNLRRWILVVFALTCLGINVIVYVLYKKHQQVVASKRWVARSYNVMINVNNVFYKLQDMVIAQRGYLLTKDEAFLEPYRKANKIIDDEFEYTAKIARDNPARQESLQALKLLIDRKRQLLQQHVQIKRTSGLVSESHMQSSKAVMDQIRKMHEAILSEEQALLDQRSIESEAQQRNYVMTLFASAGLSILGLIVANGIIVFLTIRRQAIEEDLKRINKEMEGFTYIASHDLRSPLVNLKGFSSEIRFGLDEIRPLIEPVLIHLPENDREHVKRIINEEVPDSLNYIHSAVEKMDKLTNAILELSRLGRRELKLESIDPKKIVQHCLNTLQHQISSKNVEINVRVLPLLTVDAFSLEQVFGNILDNAIKYLDPSRPGKIEIGGSRNFRETLFWVKDNGRGMQPHDLNKIFEIYRRGGNNVDIPGEGMGMAYVRTTLRRLGGRIWCDTTAGKGSTFYFTVSNTLKRGREK